MNVDQIKAKYQIEANNAIDEAGGFGLIAMATGTGKSKVIVDRAFNLRCDTTRRQPRMLIVVPTEKLRDEGWKNEFEKWDRKYTWDTCIERTCYASLHTYEGEEFDAVYLDECHNITENNSIFFHNNTVHSCVGLTATVPHDPIKARILANVLKLPISGFNKLTPTYQVTLDEAVEKGLVAPYEVTVVTLPIDTTDKYIVGGKPGKYFMQTELERYSYLTRLVEFGTNPMNRINRMQFIYKLKSKTEAAKKILHHVVPQEIRTLIFCGSKVQANAVCEHRYYSKPSKPKKASKTAIKADFDGHATERQLKSIADEEKYQKALLEYQGNASYELFFAELINRLSCCEALNEGENIPKVDCAFIIQLNAQELDLKQRMGRIIRLREGHIGKIIILATEGTVDMDWVHKATNQLDRAKVRYISYEDLRTGKEKINFN